MKKFLIFLAAVCVVACGGKLSEEQRKEMREQMELHKIRKVSEVQITEAAYAEGRKIIALINDNPSDSIKIDSLIKASGGRVRWVAPKSTNAHLLEQQLVEAYLNNESANMQDNVQKFRNGAIESDSILYTFPVMIKRADGSDELKGVWNIWLSKKQLILGMFHD
ncbi:MAG TPA: hypothetical protein VD927_18365 [Chryseosolibacter sp.]|nr:hypothetical protein [Chryseosolibacter sp.]